ncbi:MAG: peptide deformylase [Anaerolineae bacterium]|nr:peptide deformylase [Anaerolineae bacterium]
MPVRHILKFPQEEEGLRKKSKSVKRNDPQLKSLIQDLKDTLATQDGAGLAAPQIGVHKRVALISLGQDNEEGMREPFAIINPVITKKGSPKKGFDGCLSMPGWMTWDTKRPEWLEFRARDENWKPIQMRVEDIDARVVSHEIDHLDGILFLDHLESDSKLFIVRIDENGEEKLVEITQLLSGR